MRLLFRRILATHGCREIASEREFTELAADPSAIAAGHDAEIEFPRERTQDTPRAGQQWRPLEFVGSRPQAVGCNPLRAREQRCAIHAIPVWGVMHINFAFGPLDFKRPEHGKIGADVRSVGIQQRAIPVKEDGSRAELGEFHGEGIVSERGLSNKCPGTIESDAVAERHAKI